MALIEAQYNLFLVDIGGMESIFVCQTLNE